MNNNKINEATILKQLDETEKEWLEKLDREQKLEEEIDYNKKQIAEVLVKEKASTFNIDGRVFRVGFKLDDEKDPNSLQLIIMDINYMRLTNGKGNIKKVTLNFVDNFDDENVKNLLFSGGTGLGKTYLSNCIVSSLLNKGKTVIYQTAPVMLDKLIAEMFDKNNVSNSFSENLLTADLLVIDDLGTETMNSLKFSELYKIINTRLLNQNNKVTKTIISTNLSLQQLFETYDERLVSRFVGHYDIFKFFGEDIRFKH